LAQLIQQHVAFADRAGAMYQLAWLRLEAGNMEQADQWFAQLVKEYPDNPLWADASFRLARNAARRQDVAAANRWLDELLFGVATNLNPDQRITGDSQASAATTAYDINQIVCHALYLQGKLSVDAGQWLAALQSYQRIVEEYPQSKLASAAWFWAAESNYHLGHLEQADLMLLQLAASAAATDDQATTDTQAAKERGQGYWAMVPLRRAQIAAHRQQWHEALELAQTIQDQFPNFSLQFEADYLIGRCMSSQARFSMARQYFRQVINSNQARNTETAAMAQWMIGETYFHQSNYDDAIRAYYRVDALYDLPQWQAAALLQAAKCYELSGQEKEAQQLYSQLRTDYPQTTFAAEATRRLRVATRTGGRDTGGQ